MVGTAACFFLKLFLPAVLLPGHLQDNSEETVLHTRQLHYQRRLLCSKGFVPAKYLHKTCMHTCYEFQLSFRSLPATTV